MVNQVRILRALATHVCSDSMSVRCVSLKIVSKQSSPAESSYTEDHPGKPCLDMADGGLLPCALLNTMVAKF